MRALKLTLTGMIVANVILAVMLLSGNLSPNTSEAQVADRAGQYLGVTGAISSTRDVLYVINTRDDRLAVLQWSDPYKKLELLANVDLREAFATQVGGR